MAWVIIGGLTSSLILTLFVVPATYLIVDRLKDRLSGKNKKTKKAPEKAVSEAI
jgi:HAE1 family hydrophobic/amphiphilic exporter-1